MKVEEKVNKIVSLAQSITTTKEMITKIKGALMNDRLIMNVLNASDATLLNYYDKECSKTDLIKVGLEAMKEKLEENLSVFEQQLEDMLR